MTDKDYRMDFIKNVETSLLTNFNISQVFVISNVITKILNDYEITERCTAVVPIEDENEKILRRYRACLLVDGKSEKTVYQYIRTCRKLLYTVEKPFTEMTAYDIRYFLAIEMERGLSNRSRENSRANLSAFFRWMTNERFMHTDPVASIKRIKYKEEVRLPFSDVEIDLIRSACKKPKERAIVELLLSSGIRVSELTNMDVCDINQDTLTVHVVHGKGNKERVTYTTPVAMRYITDYINKRPENGSALFYNKNHTRLNADGVRFILNDIAKRVNMNNVHPHRFRRTFATSLARRGMDIKEIQRLLGHSDINTTTMYVHVDDSKIQSLYKMYIS